MLSDLKTKYYLNQKEHLYKQNNILNIALHIRRGDVKGTHKKYDRYTTNKTLAERVDLITSVLENKKLRFQLNIFSEGNSSDFEEFSKYKPVFFLNEDEFKTFHSLVKADILVMAKSSFSYVAALLNEGIVIYERFWHKPLKSWVQANVDSDYFKARFEAKLTSANKEVMQINSIEF